jgi:hypothetical protein
MDSMTDYGSLLKRMLTDLAALTNRRPNKDEETYCIFDDARGHYLLVDFGWRGDYRVRNTMVYARLRNGKIWIEQDLTEEGITKDLLKAGVPKEDIVLAFQHPTMRPLTEFAVA